MTLIDLTKDSDLPNLKALRELHDHHFDDGVHNSKTFEEIYLSSFFVAHIGININYFWSKLNMNINMNASILIKNLNKKPCEIVSENNLLALELEYKECLENKMKDLIVRNFNKEKKVVKQVKNQTLKKKSNHCGIVNIWISLWKRKISYPLIAENINNFVLNNLSLRKYSSICINILICDNILRGGLLLNNIEQTGFTNILNVLQKEIPKLQRINKRVLPLVLKLKSIQNNISKYVQYYEKADSTANIDHVILEEKMLNFLTEELKKIINFSQISIKKDFDKKEILQYLKETKNKHCIFVNIEKDELYQKKINISKIYRENNDKEDD